MLDGNEAVKAVKLLLVCPVASLHLAILFGAAHLGFTVPDAKVFQVPGKGLGELAAVVSLNLLDGKGQGLPDLIDEISGVSHGIMVIDAQNAKSGAIVDSGELIISFAGESQVVYEFDINLHPVARDVLAVLLRIALSLFFIPQAV